MRHVEMIVEPEEILRTKVQVWIANHPKIPWYEVNNIETLNEFLEDAKIDYEPQEEFQAALLVNAYADFHILQPYNHRAQEIKHLFCQPDLRSIVMHARNISILLTIASNYYFNVPLWARCQAGFDDRKLRIMHKAWLKDQRQQEEDRIPKAQMSWMKS
jgi:hypothetical protein